jgi:hypothetical protein
MYLGVSFFLLQLQILHFQVGGKAGVQAQLIVQSQKAMPTTMTVQQIQQVIKHVQPQHIAHVSNVTVSAYLHTTVVLKIITSFHNHLNFAFHRLHWLHHSLIFCGPCIVLQLLIKLLIVHYDGNGLYFGRLMLYIISYTFSPIFIITT